MLSEAGAGGGEVKSTWEQENISKTTTNQLLETMVSLPDVSLQVTATPATAAAEDSCCCEKKLG